MNSTGLEYLPDRPVIGIISRLVEQKGFDLVADAMNDLMAMDAQWVVLGAGENRYIDLFKATAHALPRKVWAYIGFNNELAHLIEAAADMFLMPSRYEPCGFNQMYSLRYGTVPIVRKTGGLADTINDWHEFEAQGLDTGNGFSFNDASGYAVSTSVARAINLFKNKAVWHRIQMNGMKHDFSWNASAKKYATLYERAIAIRRTSL